VITEGADFAEAAADPPGGDYASIYPRLMRLAFCLTGSNDRAEDLVQDTYSRCLHRLGAARDPEGYLRAALVNGFRSDLRRRSFAERAAPALAGPCDVTLPSALVELRDVLLSLSARQRAAVVLRYVADLDDEAIAAVLHCRRATVRSLVKRGLENLRSELT
jgi:DNA-directed RNA polymerase specialized sigma24 family protein